MRVLLTGGGTAGHINPALAIASSIRTAYPDAEILFVGAEGKMETKLVPKAGYPIKTMRVQGFYRKPTLKNLVRNVGTVWYMLTAGQVSASILKEFRPDIAIGTGGYVCGPILRKALKMGIPVLVHESNAFPGITVKALAKEGATILLCNEDARKHLPAGSHAIVTGNPLRVDFRNINTKEAKQKARQELGLDDRPVILSFGGSLGAKYINEAMVGVLLNSLKDGSLQHIHGVGSAGYAETCAALKQAGVPFQGNGISVREYIDDMPRCMAAADLIISRCGAMTLSEIPAAGKPSVLIPSPYVAENHQYHNAMTLVERGAALCIEEKDLSADSLWDAICQVTKHPTRMQEMAENAAKMAIFDADDRILQVIKDTLS
jgi:UDP-N-acetylglucosamine--N-acetylmuramyl-(pentapeptide) pyrophosphoryl-undecaprenol N-acetylglucosamine transferase